MLAGLAVAGAISFGAWVVYARATEQKLADVRQQLTDIATRMQSWRVRPEHVLDAGPPEQREKERRRWAPLFVDVRDGFEEIGRIYSVSLDENREQTVMDTGRPGETPAPRPLSELAREARRIFAADRKTPWLGSRGMEMAAFAPVRDATGRIAGALAVEADAHQVSIKLARIRESLWFTCALGALAGLVAGGVVGRMRGRSARVLAELTTSRQLQEAIIRALGEVVYTFDCATRRFHWRGKVAPLRETAVDPAGEAEESWVEQILPEDRAAYSLALDMAARLARPMEIEYRVRRPDGSFAWMLDRAQPVGEPDEHGAARSLAGSITDITARRTAEESLRLFFDETATAHLALDGDTIVDVNPAAVALFAAADATSLREEPAWRLWPRRQPDHALSASAWADKVMQTLDHGSARFEWQFVRLDGEMVDCDVFMRHATFQERGVLMLGCLDISAAKRAQAQLVESEQRFRDVSEAVGEFIWEVDRDGRYTYASPRVIEVLGVAPEHVLGHTPFDFVPEEDLAAMRERSEEILSSGGAFRNFEHRVRQPSGRVLWISVSGVPRHDAKGAVIGYRGASLDITQRRAYEQELVLQKNAAEAGGRAKGNFLAMMSHEIRTPLNSVLGFADLLMATPLDDTQREHLQTIRTSGDALLVLLNDILDLSKIESGHLEVEFRATDVPRCLREALELYRANALAKGLSLTLDLAPDVPPHVLTDASRLRQILLNLVGNAVKFTAEGGVEVSARLIAEDAAETAPRLRITVRDTGIGIHPEQGERLFLPFTQADSSTTRRFGGTGLGLAISKRLAHLLGGDLTLLENDGPGATFALDLPAIAPTPEQLAGDEAAPALERFPGNAVARIEPAPRVLVVDDNPTNRKLTAQLLAQLGAESETASSAKECFARLAGGTFDFILMDVQMPGMDGLEATRQIRAREAETGAGRRRIVALTADAMVGDRERCLAAGMDDYLTKPLRRAELARVLRGPVGA